MAIRAIMWLLSPYLLVSAKSPKLKDDDQLRIRSASALVIGAGGLGCPAAAYLAGAGVGTIGIVDGDTVEISNLHRQVLHSVRTIGVSKVDSAIEYLKNLNPHVNYIGHKEPLISDAALDLVAPYDIVLDCTDNPASRYLISDVCVLLSKPLVSASALRQDGQLMLFNSPPRPPGDASGGPCYRCMFPRPPPPESITTCGEGGILGPVVGVMGVLQALETIKLLTIDPAHIGTAARQPPQALLFSAYSATPFRTFRMCRRRRNCAACSAAPNITRESLTTGSADYAAFCGAMSASDSLAPEDRISPAEYAMMRSIRAGTGGVVLVDTREHPHFDVASVEGSVNAPFSEIGEVYARNGGDGDEPEWMRRLREHNKESKTIVAVCRLGNDSQPAVRMLREMLGAEAQPRIVDIRGGLRAWREEVEPDFPDF